MKRRQTWRVRLDNSGQIGDFEFRQMTNGIFMKITDQYNNRIIATFEIADVDRARLAAALLKGLEK